MKLVSTWSQIQHQFLRVAKDYPTLSAQWREVFQTWILRPDMLRAVPGDFPKSSLQFKASATAAVTRLRKKSRHKEPWQLWLNLLRDHLESNGLGDRQDARGSDSVAVVRDYFGEPGRYSDWGGAIYLSVRERSLMREPRRFRKCQALLFLPGRKMSVAYVFPRTAVPGSSP